MSFITKEGFVRIGMPWGFNEFTDIDGYFTEKIYSSINIVDFIPIIPQIDTGIINNIKDEADIGKVISGLYKPDPELGCKYYNSLLDKFHLTSGCDKIKGVRLYITDQTQLAETISNSYTENTFNKLMNKGLEKIHQIRQYGQLLSGVYAPPNLLNTLADLENNKIDNVLQTMNALLSGLRIDYPVVWQNTDYVRRITLNVNLSTPYGDPEAVWVWIVMPLLYLILLGTPVNWGGPVGYPLYVSVRSHGLFYIELGAIENITIDRGGQNTSYNIYRQPLSVQLNITIRDLYSSLSVDPKTKINTKEVITTPTNETSILNTSNVSLPTVDKLVRSFAPDLSDNTLKTYKSRLSYTNNEQSDTEALETVKQLNFASTQELLTSENKTTNTIQESSIITDKIKNLNDTTIV